MDSNVIVVGAGPTGCFAALHAARLGAKITICEEHDKIGAPSHCTGHISLAGLKRFNLQLSKKVFENEIKSAIFYSPSGYQFSVRFASPVTCVVNRELFDQNLCNLAAKAGAEILCNTHIESFLVEKGFVKGVVAKRRKRIKKLGAKVVVDAEGVSSYLLKRAGFPSLNRRMTVNGVQAEVDHVKGLEDDTVEVFFSRSFAPGFFAWIVPRWDGTAKVGLATAEGNPQECLRYFIRHNSIAHRRLKTSQITNLAYHPLSLGGPIHRTYNNGLLIVGDAASHVKPTTGGGVVMGLTCAKIAGQTAAYAVEYKDNSACFLSEYERRWRKKINFDMKVMKQLRLIFNNLSEKQLDTTIAICTRLRFHESLENVKDIDFQGTSLISIAKSPRILATALYLLLTSVL